MNDWMQCQIENQEYWTAEVWLASRKGIVKYYQSIEPRATLAELLQQIRCLGKVYGTYSEPIICTERGEIKDVTTLEAVKSYPRLVICELEIDRRNGQRKILGDIPELCRWYREITKDFYDRRDAEERAGQFQQFLMSTLKDMLKAWRRKKYLEDQVESQRSESSTHEIMERLERTFLGMVAGERSKISRQYVRRMEDCFDRSRRMENWTQLGWFIHGCFTSLWCSIGGLTDESGVALELLGDTDYGGGHGPPWKGIGSPLVLAGKAGTGGSDRLPSDCSQSEPQSHLPTGLHARGPSADFNCDLTRALADSVDLPVPSVHPEGRTEHRDGILPMVTSALEQNSSIPSQGSDRQPSGETLSTEDHVVVQEQARKVTVPESRPEISGKDLDSLWAVMSQSLEVDLAERKLAGKEVLKYMSIDRMSDDQLEW
jgi:hypothetical protein